jgi:hypothetical protein
MIVGTTPFFLTQTVAFESMLPGVFLSSGISVTTVFVIHPFV